MKGLGDDRRYLEYLDALINYVSKVELNDNVRVELGRKFIELGKKLLGGG